VSKEKKKPAKVTMVATRKSKVKGQKGNAVRKAAAG
jgi:hypothetical protein